MQKVSYSALFTTFFKIGLFTFGGGYVMLSVMQKEIVDQKKWVDEKTMIDLVGISESTPGPFSVNAATFIGYQLKGFLGSMLATLGVVLPAFLVILLVSIFLEAFQDNMYLQNTLKGINAGVSVLIFHAWFRLTKQLGLNIFNLILMAIGILVTLIFPQFSVIYLILIVALTGLIASFFRKDDQDVNGTH